MPPLLFGLSFMLRRGLKKTEVKDDGIFFSEISVQGNEQFF